MPLTLQELRTQSCWNPEIMRQKLSETHPRPIKIVKKPSETLKKVWKRVRRLSDATGTPILTTRKIYKNLSETQKRSLDFIEIPWATMWECRRIFEKLQGTTRRPSKGNPNRLVRAGAPNEYIQTPPEPTQVPLDSLKELKKLRDNYFKGNWDLLAEFVETIRNIQKALK